MTTKAQQPSQVAMDAARALYPFGAEPVGRHEQMIRECAAIIDRHLEAERQQQREDAAAHKSLRCELVTIFGMPPERIGATWNERMLGQIGKQLANVEAERQEVREVLRDALRAYRGQLYTLPPSDEFSVSAQKDILSARIGRAESLLARMGGE